jgi:hypothetical protein
MPGDFFSALIILPAPIIFLALGIFYLYPLMDLSFSKPLKMMIDNARQYLSIALLEIFKGYFEVPNLYFRLSNDVYFHY